MDKKILITIGRQYGSGGHEIGELLSQKLNLPLYDKEILLEAAKCSGLSKEIFKKFDEKPTNSFLYSLLVEAHSNKTSSGEYDIALPEKIFLSEFNAIQKIADENSGIFIGRCADYALENYSNRISIFIYAPMRERIMRIKQRHNICEKDATELIIRTDKQRASYYNYYTTHKWGHINSYHFCIDSSLCGIEGTSNIIISLLNDNGFLNK